MFSVSLIDDLTLKINLSKVKFIANIKNGNMLDEKDKLCVCYYFFLTRLLHVS